MNNKAFAVWLAQRRKDAGLTQEALAKMIGVEKAFISKWETARPGEPTLYRLQRLSKVLGTSLTEPLVIMGYLKPERDIEPHVMRILHYYRSLPKPEQKLAEEIIKTLWRERGVKEEDQDDEKKGRKSA